MAITRLGPNQDITAAKIAGQINFKNLIINGDMSIAQRGTSTSSITGAGYNTIDRMRLNGATFGTWTQSQSTDVPSGQGFAKSLKMDCTTANSSLSASSHMFLETRIEGQNLQYLKKGTANAESVTASFWVKSNKTGTYICELRDEDNLRQIDKSYTINSANTWEKKTITFEGDTTGAFDNDNAVSLRFCFWLVAGTDYNSGTLGTSWQTVNNPDRAVGQVNLADDTANEWFITGIQLEADTAASDFEFLPRDINIQRCARYFVKIDTNNAGNNNTFVDSLYGVAGTDSVAFLPYENIVPFRTAPSLSQSAVISLDEYFVAVRTQSSTSIASNNPQSRHGANIKLSNFSSMTRGNGVQLNSGGTINMDAEL